MGQENKGNAPEHDPKGPNHDPTVHDPGQMQKVLNDADKNEGRTPNPGPSSSPPTDS